MKWAEDAQRIKQAKDAQRMKWTEDAQEMKWAEEAQGIEGIGPVGMLGNKDQKKE